MKKKSIQSVLLAAFFALSFYASGSDNPPASNPMPDNVKAIIQNSCFGCHNTNSKNEDGKEALDFKKLDNLSMIKQISAYTDIKEVLEEGEMPPKKFLEKKPEKKLSDEQTKILLDWSKKAAEELVKGN